jgi:hypothetical protein
MPLVGTVRVPASGMRTVHLACPCCLLHPVNNDTVLLTYLKVKLNEGGIAELVHRTPRCRFDVGQVALGELGRARELPAFRLWAGQVRLLPCEVKLDILIGNRNVIQR